MYIKMELAENRARFEVDQVENKALFRTLRAELDADRSKSVQNIAELEAGLNDLDANDRGSWRDYLKSALGLPGSPPWPSDYSYFDVVQAFVARVQLAFDDLAEYSD